MSIFSKLFSSEHTEGVKAFGPLVPKINELEPKMRALSDEELKTKTDEFKNRLSKKTKSDQHVVPAEARKGESEPHSASAAKQQEIDKSLNEILPEAFAVVREAARRTLGQRHFDVQLIGGMVLNAGGIAEMRTGEGKTLVATLPAYLNALTGKGVHIVTVNDYLSRRDAVWMGQIYNALGLSVGVINHEASFLYDPKHKEEDKKRDETGSFHVVHEFLRPCTRREAYAADITYGTNVEFGFDYLRDNLEYSADRLRQRDFNYAIVDEIDSILIDEARTPLIISAPTSEAEGMYKQFASLVSSFKQDEDYTVEEKHKAVSLTQAGITKAEKALGIENLYTDTGIKSVHHLETAVKAKALYHKDKEYVVKNNEIIIVDEFTGRLQPGRRWSEGLHQAIEAKESVKIQQESRTYASITYQNFFRMYPKLSGMTGTAATSSEEFFKVYGLSVYSVPTNQPMVRLDRNDQIFRTEIGKFKAIARTVKEHHQKGQPVLIGTVSIEKNELLSQFLKSEGIQHTILNAKPEYAEREGEIVAQAGKKGGVTIATNMAGRGVDIKLGGNPNTQEVYEEIKKAGGLFVLGTERHEARRIDNQLRGRSGRQGDPGETQFFVSLEDQLMRVFASDTLKSMMGRLGMPEDQPIEHKLISRALESAQEKIEGFNFDARKRVLEFDDVINTQRSAIYGRRKRLLLGTTDDIEAELNEIIGESGEVTSGKLQVASKSQIGNPPLKKQTTGEVSEEISDSEASHKIIKKKISEFGREPFLQAMRIVLLQTIDMFWVEHLEVMDYTRGSVNLRAYGQRDPLVEYKREGLRLFREMQAAMRGQIMRLLPNIVPIQSGASIKAQGASGSQQLKEVGRSAQQITSSGSNSIQFSNQDSHPEIGRNDPCWCGSGKKYKKCHGAGK